MGRRRVARKPRVATEFYDGQQDGLGSREMDWGGGPSYGVGGGGGSRDYSLLSPAMPRKGSVVTFDVGEPGVRRHSSPVQPPRRKNAVTSTSSMGDCQQPLSSALKYGKDPSSPQRQRQQLPVIRYVDDYRTLTELRKRSAGDQSIISIRIDEDDSGEEEEGREECIQVDDDDDDEEEEEDCCDERVPLKTEQQKHREDGMTGQEDPLEQLKRRRASLKRNHVDESDVERRMERLFHEIDFSVDSVEDSSKFITTTSHSSGETAAPPGDCSQNDSGAVLRVEVETQTTADDNQQVSNVNPLTPTVAIMGVLAVPDRVKRWFVIFEIWAV